MPRQNADEGTMTGCPSLPGPQVAAFTADPREPAFMVSKSRPTVFPLPRKECGGRTLCQRQLPLIGAFASQTDKVPL